MKMAAAVVLVVFCGCGGQQTDRIAKLEERMNRAEQQNEKVRTNLAAFMESMAASFEERLRSDSNIVAMIEREEVARAANQAEIEDKLDAYFRAHDSKTTPVMSAAAQVARGTAPATKPAPASRGTVAGAIPPDVYSRIRSQAAKDWPNDYEMQAYQIDNQVKAYRKLNP